MAMDRQPPVGIPPGFPDDRAHRLLLERAARRLREGRPLTFRQRQAVEAEARIRELEEEEARERELRELMRAPAGSMRFEVRDLGGEGIPHIGRSFRGRGMSLDEDR